MIKKLTRYIGNYKKFVYLVPILVFLDTLFELSIPLLMARIIDTGIPTGDVPFILKTGGFMILLAIAASAFGVGVMYTSTKASMGFGANLRNALFEKVSAFSFSNIDYFSTASLITRLTNDVNNVQMTFLMSLRMLLRAPMMLIIAFMLALSINARLSLVLAVAIPILAVGVIVIMRSAAKLFAAVQERIDDMNNTLQENLIGIRVVKAFVRAGYEIEKFTKANDALTEAGIRAISLVILNMPMMMFVMNGATLGVIWFGGRMVSAGDMGTGELISFISYIFQILMSVMMLSMIVVMSARAQASARRVIEVLDTQIDILDAPVSAADQGSVKLSLQSGKVEFRDVAFRYSSSGSGEDVLCGINFSAEHGEIVGLIGGTGTGKSTLIHLIPRLYDVSHGTVLVDGTDVRHYSLETLREQIGVVLQKNTLFSGTVRENLLWGNQEASQEEIEQACQIAQAHAFILELPDGYETQLGQGGVNLSGGQKQRVCIARALLKKPKILILDDSTSAVDTATEAKIRQAFMKQLAHTTVFIIAQRISSVREADKIIILDDGKIAGMGKHEELLAKNKIYQEINASQQEGVLANG